MMTQVSESMKATILIVIGACCALPLAGVAQVQTAPVTRLGQPGRIVIRPPLVRPATNVPPRVATNVPPPAVTVVRPRVLPPRAVAPPPKPVAVSTNQVDGEIPLEMARLEDMVFEDKPYEDPSLKLRASRAETIRGLGVEVDPNAHTSAELMDIEMRIRASQRLHQLGYDMDWEVYPLEKLEDREQRLLKARTLERKGVEVNWISQSLAEMTDIENRVRKAERLAKLGPPVDWRKYSLQELSDMEIRKYQLLGRR